MYTHTCTDPPEFMYRLLLDNTILYLKVQNTFCCCHGKELPSVGVCGILTSSAGSFSYSLFASMEQNKLLTFQNTFIFRESKTLLCKFAALHLSPDAWRDFMFFWMTKSFHCCFSEDFASPKVIFRRIYLFVLIGHFYQNSEILLKLPCRNLIIKLAKSIS